MSEAKIVNLPGLEPEKPKEKAKKSAPQLWADVFTATLVKAITPMGFKKHKTGRIVARLDLITRERIEIAAKAILNVDANHINTILEELRQEKKTTEKAIESLKWYQFIQKAQLKSELQAIESAIAIVANTEPKIANRS